MKGERALTVKTLGTYVHYSPFLCCCIISSCGYCCCYTTVRIGKTCSLPVYTSRTWSAGLFCSIHPGIHRYFVVIPSRPVTITISHSLISLGLVLDPSTSSKTLSPLSPSTIHHPSPTLLFLLLQSTPPPPKGRPIIATLNFSIDIFYLPLRRLASGICPFDFFALVSSIPELLIRPSAKLGLAVQSWELLAFAFSRAISCARACLLGPRSTLLNFFPLKTTTDNLLPILSRFAGAA